LLLAQFTTMRGGSRATWLGRTSGRADTSKCSLFVLDRACASHLRCGGNNGVRGGSMYGQIATVAFVGIEARPVEVQVRISAGQHVLAIVGLPDKAVAESRERVRNA